MKGKRKETSFSLKNTVIGLLVNLPVALLSLTCIFPVVWLLYSSLKTPQEFAKSVVALPEQIQFDNYRAAFKTANFDIFLWNSLRNSLISMLVIVLITFVMGYLLSRYRFRGRNLIYGTLLAGIMIPVHALMVPLFIQFKSLSILNRWFTLVPVYVAFEIPTSVFLIDGYLKGVSTDLEDAASIDGAGLLRTMFSIILPVCKPIMATVIILAFMHVWNEFPFAQILISAKELKTVPVGLTYFTTDHSTDYTQLMAGLAMATLPVIVLYLAFYNKIMEGMMAGSIKG